MILEQGKIHKPFRLAKCLLAKNFGLFLPTFYTFTRQCARAKSGFQAEGEEQLSGQPGAPGIEIPKNT
jgi:hypothetical protein